MRLQVSEVFARIIKSLYRLRDYSCFLKVMVGEADTWKFWPSFSRRLNWPVWSECKPGKEKKKTQQQQPKKKTKKKTTYFFLFLVVIIICLFLFLVSSIQRELIHRYKEMICCLSQYKANLNPKFKLENSKWSFTICL